MRLSFRRGLALSALALGLAAPFIPVAAPGATLAPADAQVATDGNYRFNQPHQSDPVAWCHRSANGAAEYWAYVQGEYEWANGDHTPQSPWELSGCRVSTTSYSSFTDWKNWVLGLAATQGKTIRFQDMSVTEETIDN